MSQFHTMSAAETQALGRSFARSLMPGDVVAVSGNLGAGKTRFITGVCEGLGAQGHVSSPTFTLIHEYPARSAPIIHIDLYRISSRREAVELGLHEYFDTGHICLIEWAEKILDMLPPHYRLVKIEFGDAREERHVTIEEVTPASIVPGGYET